MLFLLSRRQTQQRIPYLPTLDTLVAGVAPTSSFRSAACGRFAALEPKKVPAISCYLVGTCCFLRGCLFRMVGDKTYFFPALPGNLEGAPFYAFREERLQSAAARSYTS